MSNLNPAPPVAAGCPRARAGEAGLGTQTVMRRTR